MPLTLGLIAGLLSFIPNFGPIISAVPAIFWRLSTARSRRSTCWALHRRPACRIEPGDADDRAANSRAAAGADDCFSAWPAVLVGGLGLVLATPLLALIMVVVQMVYVEDVLGDRTTEVNEKVRKGKDKTRGQRTKKRRREGCRRQCRSAVKFMIERYTLPEMGGDLVAAEQISKVAGRRDRRLRGARRGRHRFPRTPCGDQSRRRRLRSNASTRSRRRPTTTLSRLRRIWPRTSARRRDSFITA